ncbi:hypothetical protein [Cecembia rubra]|uniref:hypothetical protein n=1 Tax=Cecembia rubra TaxID=1485585 RepID=UPI002714DC3F|nr:hypothetical protein [Cecembia rubra]
MEKKEINQKNFEGLIFEKEVISRIESGEKDQSRTVSMVLVTWCGTCPGDGPNCGNATVGCQ